MPDPTDALGRAAAADQPWRFLFANDLHYHDEACQPWFEQTLDAMRQSAPDAAFCLLGGDLVEHGTHAQLTGIGKALSRLGMPLYSVPGNHDYVTQNSRWAYEVLFPDQVNHSFTHRGWQFLGLDTTEGLLWDQTSIGRATLDWLDAALENVDPRLPTVVWTHFPLAPGAPHRPLNADALGEKLAGLNLQAVYSGHWHAATAASWLGATCTTTPCCSRYRANHDGTEAKGWLVCTVQGSDVSHEFCVAPAEG